MTEKEKRKFILDFIGDNFKEHMFDRMQEMQEEGVERTKEFVKLPVMKGISTGKIDEVDDVNFENYDAFINHNKQHIKKLDVDDLDFVYALCKQIKKQKITMVDEEYFISWEAVGIYYNKKGNLTIMHPR